MKIAILGASSQIARDLIVSFTQTAEHGLHLFARRTSAVRSWLVTNGLEGHYPVDDFMAFDNYDFDVVINFVGAGDPAKLGAMGNTIFDITLRFDEMVMEYLKTHPACRYLFMSSGAAYGSDFTEPVKRDTPATVRINDLASQEWYGVAKLHAECRHRAHPEFTIFDIRVFNYFSRTQDINARFLISDILRAIRDKTVLKTSPDHIVRDYLHPSDFHRLVTALLAAPAANAAVDCYSLAPIDKLTLLAAMQEKFGLRYEFSEASASINATGSKPNYYSLNRRAAEFRYVPKYTSTEGILEESGMVLDLAFPR